MDDEIIKSILIQRQKELSEIFNSEDYEKIYSQIAKVYVDAIEQILNGYS